jgi:LuxR family maltose regulon positive regulatory protein
MKTSIVASFDTELVSALTGLQNSTALIDRIVRENLFVFAIDDSCRRYRYHRLFADVLRFRLERDAPDQAGALHRSACSWLIEHNRPQEAASHAIELRDWDLAVKLLDPVRGGAVVRFQGIVDWIRTLPEDALRMQPVLSIWNAWSEMKAGHVRAAERAIDIAEHEWKTRGETQYRGEIFYLRSRIARCRGEGRLAVSLAEQSLSVLPADAWMLRIMSTISLSCGYAISGMPVEAEAAATEAYVLGLQVDYAGECVVGTPLAYKGRTQIQQGRLTEAWNTLQDALTICSRASDGIPIPILIALAELLINRNDLEEGSKLLNDALLRIRQENAAVYKPEIWMQLARVAWAQGNNDLALSTLDYTLSWCRRNGCKAIQMSAESFRARIWLAEGNPAKTEAWLERCSLDEEGDIPNDQEPAYYVQACFLMHQHRTSGNSSYCGRALHILRQLGNQALTDNRRLDAVQALVLGAIARDEVGDMAKAFAQLERAFSIALPERAIRVFLDEGDAMYRLVQMARDRGSMGAELNVLIEAFDHIVADKRQNVPPPEARVVELSKREQEILRYVAAGLTNQEIADRMFISVNTVKTHLKHIFSKVGATSRAQAIARAYALGLL